MKLRDLVPSFYIHISGSNLYIPTIGLNLNLYFPVLRGRVLGSTTGAEIKAGTCRQAGGWRQFHALPSSPVVEPRVHINDRHTNFQFGKLQIINGNN